MSSSRAAVCSLFGTSDQFLEQNFSIQKLSELLDRGKKQVTLLLPYAAAGLLDSLNREAKVLRTEYTDSGIEVEAVVQPDLFGRVKQYIPCYEEPKEDWED